jgi:hypothetical protein
LEYSNLLDKAAECEDSQEQLAYVTAFIVSSAATSSERKCKPFNPMLGETYECDRLDDLGWRSIAEQVSHHPPALALVKTHSYYLLIIKFRNYLSQMEFLTLTIFGKRKCISTLFTKKMSNGCLLIF